MAHRQQRKWTKLQVPCKEDGHKTRNQSFAWGQSSASYSVDLLCHRTEPFGQRTESRELTMLMQVLR